MPTEFSFNNPKLSETDFRRHLKQLKTNRESRMEHANAIAVIENSNKLDEARVTIRTQATEIFELREDN